MEQRWIPVSERLPDEPKENPIFEGEKIELYLVTVKGADYPFRAFWNGKFFTDGWSKADVTAWRPLPEPYRGEEPKQTNADRIRSMTDEDAEEQGFFLRLPCGIGADVYIIPSKVNYELNILNQHPENNKVYHQKVALITFTEKGWYMECDKDREYATDRILSEKMYKKIWFLSQEEAEAKLKEMEGSYDGE